MQSRSYEKMPNNVTGPVANQQLMPDDLQRGEAMTVG